MKHICIIILVFSLFSCKNQHQNNIYPIQRLENYNGNVNYSVEEKILAAPEIIINSLNEMDNVNNYASYELDDNERQLFMNYYSTIPLKYKNIVNEKVVGIYFVDNFLGGGMTEPIFDSKGNMYMALFFNPEILHRSVTDLFSAVETYFETARHGRQADVLFFFIKNNEALFNKIHHFRSFMYYP